MRIRLGDVTTPTGGGSGILDQIKSWFTGSVPNAANSPANVQEWMAEVKSRGNVVTRYPYTDDLANQGDLAERQQENDGSYTYFPAPDDVINADRVLRGLSTLAPVTGTVAAAGQRAGEAVQAGTKIILSAPRQALADALGISPGFVTVLLVLGGVTLAYKTLRRGTR
jgi:hypothetical protein